MGVARHVTDEVTYTTSGGRRSASLNLASLSPLSPRFAPIDITAVDCCHQRALSHCQEYLLCCLGSLGLASPRQSQLQQQASRYPSKAPAQDPLRLSARLSSKSSVPRPTSAPHVGRQGSADYGMAMVTAITKHNRRGRRPAEQLGRLGGASAIGMIQRDSA